jgi:hypothetical protein
VAQGSACVQPQARRISRQQVGIHLTPFERHFKRAQFTQEDWVGCVRRMSTSISGSRSGRVSS